jgi:DNA-binding FrmR family transcriptional regulator
MQMRSIHSHTHVINRLKRVEGHIKTIIAMIEAKRDCLDVAQQLHAIEKAIQNAKKIYLHDHIDNCLETVAGSDTRQARNSLAEFRKIAKYL